MIWDPEWNGERAEKTPGKGYGPEWERLNNSIRVDWMGFNQRLEEHDQERVKRDMPPMAPEHRRNHVERFKRHLEARYGQSTVDPRWEAEVARRLADREKPSRGGGGGRAA